MKLIIDIPNWLYNAIMEHHEPVYSQSLGDAVRDGTPLQKGYGRLIDADAYRKELRIEIPNLDYDGSLEPYEEGIYSAIMSLDDTPTIIEADKEVQDADSN